MGNSTDKDKISIGLVRREIKKWAKIWNLNNSKTGEPDNLIEKNDLTMLFERLKREAKKEKQVVKESGESESGGV